MNSGRVGVLGVVDGKESGKVPGPRKLEPERGEPGCQWGQARMCGQTAPCCNCWEGGCSFHWRPCCPPPWWRPHLYSMSTTSPA